MDIHDFKNNLEEINNYPENDKIIENNINIKVDDELDLSGVNINTIHTINTIDNNTIKVDDNINDEKITEMTNKLLNGMKYRSNQPTSIKKNNINNNSVNINKVKQMIKASRPEIRKYIEKKGYYVDHKINIVRGKNIINPSKHGNLITKHSVGNYIRNSIGEPEIAQIPQIPHIFVENRQLRNDPLNGDIEVDPWTTVPLIYRGIKPDVEKPKELNLAEIVTSALQDILTGKITSIDAVIGKLRTEFEDKNIFTNSNKRNIMLINFEDDTIRPVLKIDNTYMDIIQKWYDDCDLSIDIEETSQFIPESITDQDISGVLYQDMSCKYKDEYLNQYIPTVVNNIISERTIKSFEKNCFKKTTEIKPAIQSDFYIGDDLYMTHTPAVFRETTNNTSTNKIVSQHLSDIGINIPKNLIPEKVTKDYNNNIKINNIHDKITPWNLPDIGKRIDPEILLKKYVITNPSDKNNNEHNNNSFECYNQEYNVLYPKFAENSLIVNEYESEQTTSSDSKMSSVFVLMNDKFLQTMTLVNPDENECYVIEHYPEFGFVKLFGIQTNNQDIVDFIKREFTKIQFNDIDEINKKLLVISQYIDFSNKHMNSNNLVNSEESQVKKFLESNYTIDNDINHKMKASTLYDIILNSNFIKIDKDKMSGFKIRLSKYLKDAGLQKKRYNDGFYYYGIIDKTYKNISLSNCNTRDNKPLISISEIIKIRDEEISEIEKNRKLI